MALYASSKDCPKLKLSLADGTVIQFKQCTFDTDSMSKSAAVEIELDGYIKEQPNVSMLVRKIDRSAALKLAQEHQERAMAVKGPTSSVDLRNATRDNMDARDAELALASADPEQAAAMAEQIKADDISLTESGVGHVEPENNDGFTPVETPAVAEPEVAPETPAPVPTSDHTPEAEKPATAKKFNQLIKPKG